MQNKVWLIPQAGMLVRDPLTRNELPAEGEEKVLSTFWNRRILQGDVRVGEAPAPKVVAEESKTKKI